MMEPKTTFLVKNHNLVDKHSSRLSLSPLSESNLFLIRSSSLSSKATKATTTDITTNSNIPNKNKSTRFITKIDKFARLPVWPAWNGVFLFLISKLFGNDLAAKLEHQIGGRVCPNFFNPPEQTSPFIMLVHHRHSFAPWDPLRIFQKKLILPEGFPSHPHRGFITVTYCLKGGMLHRDSMGVKQVYGAEQRHDGKHTQWLTTGAGLLHEEMWDIQPDTESWFPQPSSQELYQLWLNVPSHQKLVPPSVELLGGDDSTPTVIGGGGIDDDDDDDDTQPNDTNHGKTKTIVICGEYANQKASIETASEVTILHVEMDPGSTWTHSIPNTHRTALLYMRTGSITMNGIDNENDDGIKSVRIPPHHTAYLSSSGDELMIQCPMNKDNEKADFLLLTGMPLNEPVSAQGSMVMNYPDEINTAYYDYQMGLMGRPWDHQLTDEEWKEHIRNNPSEYNY